MSQPTEPANSHDLSTSPVQVPLQVGPWQICKQLGQGSLTTVYQARPSETESTATYAVKVLDRCYQDDAEIVSLFRREAAAGRTLEHPHLVSVLDCQINEAPYYIVMPELCGQTLRERLDHPWRAQPLAATWIARQIATALDALHGENWLHGDLKPANIHVAPNGHVTLLDLGFAQKPTVSHPTESAGVGTGHYLAPEVLLTNHGRDIRSDIYSLGAVLYEILTGHPPFEAESLAHLVEFHRQDRVTDIRHLRRDIPCELADLVMSMLAKQPLRRPQTPDDVARRLVRMEVGLLTSSVAA
ncbi:MAG: serine/threonine protein kinase [Pirellulales bacterium]|nr:serine/threonine protein kinase [Pirellulales bacterium]